MKAKIATIAALCAMLEMILAPQQMIESGRYALSLCAELIIPSLFPFFVLSGLLNRGTDMQIPEKILDTKASIFLTWYNEKCIEAIYANGDEEVARVRKDEGSADISGDYNDYSSVVDREINGVSVTFKGNDGKVMLAVWAVDGCGYSISVPNGITADEMAALVGQVK